MKYKTQEITQNTYMATRFIMMNGWFVNLSRQYRACGVRLAMGNVFLRRCLRVDLERMDPSKFDCVLHMATAMTAGTRIPNVQKPFSSDYGNWTELNRRWNTQIFGFTTATSIIYRIDGTSCTAGNGQQITETHTI